MNTLSALDNGFLLAESRETPMHVGGLYLFTLPEGAEMEAFLADQLRILRGTTRWRRPFDHKLNSPRPGALRRWVPDEALDIDYHVRHSALPRPGRFRELFALTGRLHQTLLDRHRPLWELYLIEGLKGGRQLAMYSKVHHAVIDGVGGVRLARTILSTDPAERREFSPFSEEAREFARAQRSSPAPLTGPPSEGELRAVAAALRESLGAGRNVLHNLRTYARAWRRPERGDLTTSWTPAPQTSISTKITGARRFVAQSYSLERVRSVGRALGGTINDVVLAMCGGALRRYLQARGELPDAPLTALTPVSLRGDSDDCAGNAVGAITANLATHIADPLQRFERIQASMNEGKRLLQQMSPKEVALFTQITQAPPLMVGALGLADRFSPFSTVISNVPGVRERSYWSGARLDGMYPVSAVFHGFAMNITLLSNADKLDFGVVACRASVPSCQRIIDDLEASLAELEASAGLAAGR
jgi:diacylglycerol O-acyltransferase